MQNMTSVKHSWIESLRKSLLAEPVENKMSFLIDREFDAIFELFNCKSGSYGANNDIFHNFRMTAIRLFGQDTWDAMFKVIEVYKDKHNVALAKGIDVPEVRERLRDNILYSLLQLAMLEEYEKETE